MCYFLIVVNLQYSCKLAVVVAIATDVAVATDVAIATDVAVTFATDVAFAVAFATDLGQEWEWRSTVSLSSVHC